MGAIYREVRCGNAVHGNPLWERRAGKSFVAGSARERFEVLSLGQGSTRAIPGCAYIYITIYARGYSLSLPFNTYNYVRTQRLTQIIPRTRWLKGLDNDRWVGASPPTCRVMWAAVVAAPYPEGGFFW